jgi:tetratricopeptide (TPR) repeat protein
MIPLRKTALWSLGILLVTGCGTGDAKDAGAAHTPVAMLPMTTSVEKARAEVTEGIWLSDVGRPTAEVYPHFQRAIEADSTFAFAHFLAWGSAPSFAEARIHLLRAAALADGASDAERLLIQAQFKAGVEGDPESALALAEQLVQLHPDNPRAWLALGGRQAGVSQIKASRESLDKALALDPDFIATHLVFYDAYTLSFPLDIAIAEQHIQKAIELVPDEAFPLYRLGQLRRVQQGRFAEAVDLDARAAALNPKWADPLQQRAHANIFLGNYDEARADYDAAIALDEGNSKGSFAYSRALVSTYAGDPAATVAELQQLADAVDGMGLPDPDAQKINALRAIVFIASYNGLSDAADAAVEQLAEVRRRRAEAVGTDVERRIQEVAIAQEEGLVAAYKGDFALASRKAQEMIKLNELVRSPRRNEGAEALMGVIALRQGKYPEATAHFAERMKTYVRDGAVTTLDTYFTFQHGLALEGAGRMQEANEKYNGVNNYFGASLGGSIVRKDALAKSPG